MIIIIIIIKYYYYYYYYYYCYYYHYYYYYLSIIILLTIIIIIIITIIIISIIINIIINIIITTNIIIIITIIHYYLYIDTLILSFLGSFTLPDSTAIVILLPSVSHWWGNFCFFEILAFNASILEKWSCCQWQCLIQCISYTVVNCIYIKNIYNVALPLFQLYL